MRATQFDEFADPIVASMTQGSTVRVPDALTQQIAADDVAAAVARAAESQPLNDTADIGGPMHPDLSKNLPSARPRGIVKHMKSREIVEELWDEVWNAHDPDALDRFVTDDVVVVAGGQEISGKDKFKASIKELLDKVNDLHLDAIETFQNEDGTRVTSRWVLTGTNNGVLGTEPNQKPIAMTGTAIWEVREDGKLVRNTVEQASFELYHYLLEK